MQQNKNVIHIGLPKTGTTYMQNIIFPNIDEYLLVRGWNSIRDIISANSLQHGKPLLISDESLSGRIFSEHYLKDISDNVGFLKNTFGDVKIIIGFRKHHSYLLSLYKQYLHQGGYIEMNEFFNTQNSGIIKNEYLNYRKILENIEDSFTDVFIYTQEDLLNYESTVIEGLYKFLKINNDDYQPQKRDDTLLNVGVNTLYQVKSLKILNELEKMVSSFLHIPSVYSDTLYGRIMRKFNLTPRYICQNIFKQVGKKRAQLPAEVFGYLEKYFCDDWIYIKAKRVYRDDLG